ncbi:universal stress protein [Paenibacillus nasutitermitis]|uniref:Universal stress protein n=1 Tax=Paenibacillus nasutitermitis TaxID=1652958 RepID=A0A916ZAS9_9BACL|nr:universal stress protein [Paenibacillus nasutitermitis]GGD84796.1 universal stress protein UspA [Paenibacillus nasutitermitis]
MLYNKILVAYDGSAISEKALDSAIRMAKLNHYSKLEVIHVFNVPTYFVGSAFYIPPASVQSDYFEYAEEVIAKVKEKIADFTNTHVEVRQGSIAKTIMDYANETDTDLIVIGSRGLSSVGEFVLGSVSHNVVQHAKQPVLVVK